MSLGICDNSLKWTVFMRREANKTIELPLYQVAEEVLVGPDFADKLKYLILENPHYYAGRNVTRIVTPEQEEVKGKALFVIISYLREYTESKLGSSHHYLFGELRNHGFRLIAAANDGLTADQFRIWTRIIALKPNLVKKLVLTQMA
jgi:hypothetical protein